MDISPDSAPGPEASDESAALASRLDDLHRAELERWAEATREAQFWYDETEAMRRSVSWRVTAPLRVIRSRRLQG